ncbi:MAG TPA: mycothiol system anti-sigma-R factor [Acidimicrobiales bacterium]|nr:mycothiol system anti-sigma-R factor [Acidimicrobiales bacterium]
MTTHPGDSDVGGPAGDRSESPGANAGVGAGPREDRSGIVDAEALFGPSMNCEEAVHSLYHYLDGELTEQRREEIRVHLDWCGPCGGAAEFEAELRRIIANRCKDRVPQSLIERVAAAIDEESRQHDGGH